MNIRNIAAIAGITAAATLTAPAIAYATTIDEGDNIRYVVCADVQHGNEVRYINGYNNSQVIENGTLPQKLSTNHYCGWLDITADSDYQYDGVSIETPGNYAYCATYLNGTLIASNNDSWEYGDAYATC